MDSLGCQTTCNFKALQGVEAMDRVTVQLPLQSASQLINNDANTATHYCRANNRERNKTPHKVDDDKGTSPKKCT